MDQGLAKAVQAGTITEAMAFDRCHDPSELRDHLGNDETFTRPESGGLSIMPTTTFDYKVRDADGQLVKGQLEADSVPLVAARLEGHGLCLPVDDQTCLDQPQTGDQHPGHHGPGRPERRAPSAASWRRWSLPGAPLSGPLEYLWTRSSRSPSERPCSRVRQDVEQGSSLSTSLEKLPKVFPPLYIAMVRAGEVGGQLDSVLLKLSSTLEKQVELRQKVRSAMAYPTIVFCAVIVIVTAMMIFIVPIFKKLFTSLNGLSPYPRGS